MYFDKTSIFDDSIFNNLLEKLIFTNTVNVIHT